jgi:hypothetical protein
MCFTIDRNNLNAIVAKKNLIVYKVLENVGIYNGQTIGTSPYREYRWVQGHIEHVDKLEICYLDRIDGEILRGLHAYLTRSEAFINSRNHYNRSVIEFTIPKGSTYYINKEEDEVVSDTMIWEKPKSKFYKFFKRFWDNLNDFEYN